MASHLHPPSITIHKLVRNFIEDGEKTTTNGKPKSSLGDYSLVDVNDIEQFKTERLVGARHYDKAMISRVNYENPVIEEARKENRTLIIYGHQSERIAQILFERGYKTIHLKGVLEDFRRIYPTLIHPLNSTVNVLQLKEQYEKHRTLTNGTRLSRSTSASRSRHSSASFRSGSRERPRPPSMSRLYTPMQPPWRY